MRKVVELNDNATLPVMATEVADPCKGADGDQTQDGTVGERKKIGEALCLI